MSAHEMGNARGRRALARRTGGVRVGSLWYSQELFSSSTWPSRESSAALSEAFSGQVLAGRATSCRRTARPAKSSPIPAPAPAFAPVSADLGARRLLQQARLLRLRRRLTGGA